LAAHGQLNAPNVIADDITGMLLQLVNTIRLREPACDILDAPNYGKGSLRAMRMEVHVHGNVFLGRGVRLSQVELALKPWLEYLDVETIAEAHSLEREEPGLQFDTRERTVNICWTGEVGRNFHAQLGQAFQNLGSLTEYASEVEVTYYPENGEDEFHQMFVGPTPEAIHEFRRQCVTEDISAMLSRHLGKAEVEQVSALVNQLFDQDWATRKITGEHSLSSSTVIPLHPRNKHLH